MYNVYNVWILVDDDTLKRAERVIEDENGDIMSYPLEWRHRNTAGAWARKHCDKPFKVLRWPLRK